MVVKNAYNIKNVEIKTKAINQSNYSDIQKNKKKSLMKNDNESLINIY